MIQLDLLGEIDRNKWTLTDPQNPWVSDYVIDAHNSPSGAFSVFVGSNEYVVPFPSQRVVVTFKPRRGDVLLLKPSASLTPGAQWSMERLFSSQHDGVVRSVLWDEQVRSVHLLWHTVLSYRYLKLIERTLTNGRRGFKNMLLVKPRVERWSSFWYGSGLSVAKTDTEPNRG